MGLPLGDLLPLAVGIAVSPIPIIAVILMLFSPKARVNGISFVLGWVAGLALVAIVILALTSTVDYEVELAVVIGKTNTPEFGAGSQTFNQVFGKTVAALWRDRKSFKGKSLLSST